VRPKISETTALGAAYLAGLATGFWTSTKEIASQWQSDHRFVPTIDPKLRKKLTAQWAKALDRSKSWANE
jgi:glycerol kinase